MDPISSFHSVLRHPSFKSYPPVGDTRDSHAIDLARKLFNINCQLFFHDPIVDKAGKEFINGRQIENYLDVDIDLLVFPVIPYWYGNKNIENFFFEKFISKKRYWLYKPNLFPPNGEDYVFGEYNK